MHALSIEGVNTHYNVRSGFKHSSSMWVEEFFFFYLFLFLGNVWASTVPPIVSKPAARSNWQDVGWCRKTYYDQAVQSVRNSFVSALCCVMLEVLAVCCTLNIFFFSQILSHSLPLFFKPIIFTFVAFTLMQVKKEASKDFFIFTQELLYEMCSLFFVIALLSFAVFSVRPPLTMRQGTWQIKNVFEALTGYLPSILMLLLIWTVKRFSN